jgi:hypothetical protein
VCTVRPRREAPGHRYTGPISFLSGAPGGGQEDAARAPRPEQWYDDSNGEIGDICAWQSKAVGQYTVQMEWSNKLGRCV